ncbi:hypothetical protein MAALD49_28050 [Marinobacter shengliensis]|uniref:Uncharacterized protein n=1 Tax=Marinobacter nauticus TaxID=2743 RepID=A0A455WDP5_MARNT|nr:hypothetical protein YBY_26540 [Marinobacter nauticus]BEH15437.1 hypothetical protein MAALD49_28050 [Marinobacter shengliensis]
MAGAAASMAREAVMEISSLFINKLLEVWQKFEKFCRFVKHTIDLTSAVPTFENKYKVNKNSSLS